MNERGFRSYEFCSSSRRIDWTVLKDGMAWSPLNGSAMRWTMTDKERETHQNTTRPELNRRSFLRGAARAVGAAALLGGTPRGWVGSVFADDSPEVANMKFGMIALTDCSPIVIAHEKGLFKKYGISSVIQKGANWAAIRDSLSSGDLQGTHMLTGMPIASTMGLLGSPKKPMIIPWMLNRNGQAITLKTEWKGIVGADPK